MRIRTTILFLISLWLSCFNAIASEWVTSTKHNDVVYFFVASPPKVERYDLPSKSWLSELLPSPARKKILSGTVDEHGIYICYEESNGNLLYRYDHTLADEVQMGSVAGSLQAIHTDGNLIIINCTSGTSNNFRSFDKRTNLEVASHRDSFAPVHGSAICRKNNHIFGTTSAGGSMFDTSYITYRDDGTFQYYSDGPHHHEYPIGTRIWVFPDEDRMIDTTGIIYSTHTMKYMTELGTTISDVTFTGDNLPIVLTDNELRSFTRTMRPSGSKAIAPGARKIEFAGDAVVVFRPGTGPGIETEIISGEAIRIPSATISPAAEELPFKPTDAFTDSSGIVNLFSREHQAIFRWNPTTQEFLSSVTLHDGIRSVSYSAADGMLYLLHHSDKIGVIPLEPGSPVENTVVMIPSGAYGFTVAGNYLFTAAVDGHSTYTKDGALIDHSAALSNVLSFEYVWNDASQKVYQMRDNSSPNDLVAEELNANETAYPWIIAGGLGAAKDSPLHNSTFKGPPRPSPDGRYVAIGSGYIHDAATLERLATPGFASFGDAAWINDRLFTLGSHGSGTRLQTWSAPDFAPGPFLDLNGTPSRILALPDGKLCAITIAADGIPSLHTLTGELVILPAPSLAKPKSLGSVISGPTSATLNWQDVTGEASYLIQRREGSSDPWLEVGTSGPSAVSFTDTGLSPGHLYHYRIMAVNGAQTSPASEEIQVDFDLPSKPAISVSSVSRTQVRVLWQPAERTTTYRFYARLSTSSTWSLIAITSSLETLTNGTVGYAYEYKVQALNGIGFAESDTVAFNPSYPVPPAPVLSSAVAVEPTVVSLTWTPSNTATAYRAERRLGSSGPWSSLGNVSAPELSRLDSSLSIKTEYYYRIIAINASGNSTASASVKVITPDYPLPTTPSNLTAQLGANNSILLSWNDTQGEFNYAIQRRTGVSGEWNSVLGVSAGMNTPFCIDRSAENETTYFYRVRSSNPKGSSPYSAEVGITTRSGYGVWRLQNYSTSSETGPGAILEENGSGIPNLFRYAFNIGPLERPAKVTGNSNTGWPDVRLRAYGIHEISFVRRKATTRPGIAYQVEFSDELKNWVPGGRQTAVSASPGQFETVTWEDDPPEPGSRTKRFCRISVVSP
jgi:fibronectin type 3 domain-containing protein